jgi:hypothetical protein
MQFLTWLQTITVLNPACGLGKFLYVAIGSSTRVRATTERRKKESYPVYV